MAISGSQIKISDFLSKQKQYLIPRYQRGYVWEEKQWKELFEDLKTNYFKNNNDGHFIGSIVVFDQDSSEYTKSYVIDGQQRLTTFSLLILAVMRYADVVNNRNLFEGMNPYIKAKTPAGLAYDKFHNEHNPYYQDVLSACSTWHEDKTCIANNCDIVKKRCCFEEKFIKKCFFKLYEYLLTAINDENIDVSKFINKVMATLVIETISTDIKESYTVFEILNARGKPLENFELIKNYIMRNYESNGEPDEALVKWNMLTDTLTKNDVLLKDFFDHYVPYKYKKDFNGKAKDKLTTYDYIKRNNEDGCSKVLLEDLLLKSKQYVIFNAPDKNLDMSQEEQSNQLLNSLLFFKGRAKKQFRPLFLALFDKYYYPESLDTELIKKDFYVLSSAMVFLEKFFFTFGIVMKEPSRQFERIVHELAYSISSISKDAANEAIESMKTRFSKMLPDYITFENAVCNLGYSRKNLRYGDDEGRKEDVKYILKKYEQYLRKSSEEIPLFSIEHIHKDSGEDKYCKLGNLTCLEEKLNNDLSAKQTKTKITYYKTSIFHSANEIADNFIEWGEAQINNRSKQIATKLYSDIWLD